jgi:hypothetical protein
MALANHRKSIGRVIARQVEEFREMQAAAFARVLRQADKTEWFASADAAAIVLDSIARALVMEASIGISRGHADTRATVEKLLTCLEPRSSGTQRNGKQPVLESATTSRPVRARRASSG